MPEGEEAAFGSPIALRKSRATLVRVGALAALAGVGLALALWYSAIREVGDASSTPTAAESQPLRPSPSEVSSPTLVPPPVPALIASSGSSGAPLSWCWDDQCVDGSLDFGHPDRYPEVGTIFSVESAAAIIRLEATSFASADEPDGREIDDQTIFILQSDSRFVVVKAEFEGGGEVSYAWRVARSVIVGVGDDHVVILEPLVEVTPPRGAHDAIVHVAYTDWELLGIEGAVLFLGATDERGKVVLDRMVSPDGDEETLPPGDYVVTASYRTCSGNCDMLAEAQPFCSVDAELAPLDNLRLAISVSQRSCEVSQGG